MTEAPAPPSTPTAKLDDDETEDRRWLAEDAKIRAERASPIEAVEYFTLWSSEIWNEMEDIEKQNINSEKKEELIMCLGFKCEDARTMLREIFGLAVGLFGDDRIPRVGLALSTAGLPISNRDDLEAYVRKLSPYRWGNSPVREAEEIEQIRYSIGVGLEGVSVFDDRVIRKQPADLPNRVERWVLAGQSADIYERLGTRRDRAAGAQQLEWLVQGLMIPSGIVTLLAGAQETGKSTIATELAVAIARNRENWLGQPINRDRAKGVVVLLSGEDANATINARLTLLDPDDEAARLVVFAASGWPFQDILAEISKMPAVSLIVVDPARRYLEGDEDSSAAADAFFASLDDIARRTGAAVLVLHHLGKNASPANLAQVRDAVRGSSVFLDRPRVALGCFRLKREDVTIVGAIKSNLPPDYPIATAIKLRRDVATLRHIPVQAEAPSKPMTASGMNWSAWYSMRSFGSGLKGSGLPAPVTTSFGRCARPNSPASVETKFATLSINLLKMTSWLSAPPVSRWCRDDALPRCRQLPTPFPAIAEGGFGNCRQLGNVRQRVF
jgi:AAA domain